MRASLVRLAACASVAALLATAAPGQEPARELANRNDWQRPQEVMDDLSVQAGSAVADVGAGSGYFTLHLAGRVGPSGTVYAVEIVEQKLAGIRSLAEALNLPQIKTILGTPDNPKLPASALDAILVVNSYHEMASFNTMMRAFLRSLKPAGILGIIDAEAEPGLTRRDYLRRHQLPATVVRADARRNGLRFVREEPGFVNPDDGARWYFLLFDRPGDAATRS